MSSIRTVRPDGGPAPERDLPHEHRREREPGDERAPRRSPAGPQPRGDRDEHHESSHEDERPAGGRDPGDRRLRQHRRDDLEVAHRQAGDERDEMRRAAATPSRARMPRSRAGAPATRPGTPRGSRRSSRPGPRGSGTAATGSRRAGRRSSCPPPARPGVGIHRPSRSAIGVASATIPAVAATDSWNPIAWTSHGSSTSSASTAAARIVPVARGLPRRTPSQREARHRPGTQHRRFGAREHDEQDDDAEPEREAPDGPDLQHAGEREDRREHHRDVLARDDQQVPEPGRLEVARGDGVELRGVAEDEPEQQPRLARREDPLDRVADERADDLRHPDERRRGAADPLDLDRANADGERRDARAWPRSRGRRGSAGCPGPRADRRGRPRASRRCRSTHAVSRTVAAPPDHETRVTSTSACQPNALGSGSSRSVARSVTVRGARRRSSECSARTAPRPAQPTPQSSTPATTSAMRRAGAAPAVRRPRA